MTHLVPSAALLRPVIHQDTMWPPGEAAQLPPNQLADAKTTVVLQPKAKTNHASQALTHLVSVL